MKESEERRKESDDDLLPLHFLFLLLFLLLQGGRGRILGDKKQEVFFGREIYERFFPVNKKKNK